MYSFERKFPEFSKTQPTYFNKPSYGKGQAFNVASELRLDLVTHLTQVWSANSVWCRVSHVVTTYFTMTNYAWMLCEGAFLHFLLVLPFLEEELLVKHLWRFGWVCPLVFVLPYTIYRTIYEVNQNRDECMVDFVKLLKMDWNSGVLSSL